jgi:hypothetical protein
MPAGHEFLGDRLGLYSGGILTLVAFKYGVSDRLPCVPYQTFTDRFLLAEVLTIFMCALFTLYPFRAVKGDEWKVMVLDLTENSIAGCVFLIWSAALLYACFWKPWRRTSWRDVLVQDLIRSKADPFQKGQLDEVWDRARSDRARLSRGQSDRDAKSKAISAKSLAKMPQGCADDWTVEQVAMFISSLGLDHCLHLFKENAVDGRMLVELNKKDLEEDLGLRPLQAKKVISRLKRYSSSSLPSSSFPTSLFPLRASKLDHMV